MKQKKSSQKATSKLLEEDPYTGHWVNRIGPAIFFFGLSGIIAGFTTLRISQEIGDAIFIYGIGTAFSGLMIWLLTKMLARYFNRQRLLIEDL